jgi:hypothetical protein
MTVTRGSGADDGAAAGALPVHPHSATPPIAKRAAEAKARIVVNLTCPIRAARPVSGTDIVGGTKNACPRARHTCIVGAACSPFTSGRQEVRPNRHRGHRLSSLPPGRTAVKHYHYNNVHIMGGLGRHQRAAPWPVCRHLEAGQESGAHWHAARILHRVQIRKVRETHHALRVAACFVHLTTNHKL